MNLGCIEQWVWGWAWGEILTFAFMVALREVVRSLQEWKQALDMWRLKWMCHFCSFIQQTPIQQLFCAKHLSKNRQSLSLGTVRAVGEISVSQAGRRVSTRSELGYTPQRRGPACDLAVEDCVYVRRGEDRRVGIPATTADAPGWPEGGSSPCPGN